VHGRPALVHTSGVGREDAARLVRGLREGSASEALAWTRGTLPHARRVDERLRQQAHRDRLRDGACHAPPSAPKTPDLPKKSAKSWTRLWRCDAPPSRWAPRLAHQSSPRLTRGPNGRALRPSHRDSCPRGRCPLTEMRGASCLSVLGPVDELQSGRPVHRGAARQVGGCPFS
jgi:hypothetical protein